MKHTRLITALVFAAMLLILGLLVVSVTSCSPTLETMQPTLIVKPSPTWAPPDGTVYHPYSVNAFPGTPIDTWSVQTVNGREHWSLSWLYGPHGLSGYSLKVGAFIWYSNAKYHVLVINRSALTMSVSGPLDCCAG